MGDCVFCSIAAHDSPAHRLFEDDTTFAFLDAAPAARGHTLVAPKAHRETLTDVEPSLVGDVFRTARRVALALETVSKPTVSASCSRTAVWPVRRCSTPTSTSSPGTRTTA